VSKVIPRHANLATTQGYLGKLTDLEAIRCIENVYGLSSEAGVRCILGLPNKRIAQNRADIDQDLDPIRIEVESQSKVSPTSVHRCQSLVRSIK
jgi:hypothetical protein